MKRAVLRWQDRLFLFVDEGKTDIGTNEAISDSR